MSTSEQLSIEGGGSLSALELPGYIESVIASMVHHGTWHQDTQIAFVVDRIDSSFLVGEQVVRKGDGDGLKLYTIDAIEDVKMKKSFRLKDKDDNIVQVGEDEIVRPKDSEVSQVTPQLVLEWMNEFAMVRELSEDDDEDSCLWRVKREIRKLYGLEKEIPEEFKDRVVFPQEYAQDSSDQDDYRPSLSDAEDGDGEPDEDIVVHKPVLRARRGRRSATTSTAIPEVKHVECIQLGSICCADLNFSEGILHWIAESLDDTESRLVNDSLVRAIFDVLKAEGKAGLSLSNIVERLNEDTRKSTWSQADEDKVEALCTQEPAFFRVDTSTFALAAFYKHVNAQEGGPLLGGDGFERGRRRKNADGAAGKRRTKSSPVSTIEMRQIETLKKIAQQYDKSIAEKSNSKCGKCHRILNLGKKKVLECQLCTKLYHVECLDADLRNFVNQWCCPRCAENIQYVLQKLLDLEMKKEGALQKALSKGKVAEEKMIQKLKTKGVKLQNAQIKESVRAPRRNLTDWEVLEEEKESARKLEKRLKELKDLAKAIGMNESGDEDDEDVVESAADKVKGAEAELQRIRCIILGPPKKHDILFSNKDDFNAFNEAAGIAEFLSLYGDICELEEVLDTHELLVAASWPLDHAKQLVPLYSQLLLCCLLEQLNREAPMRSRARRWTRVLTEVTWPEILRRYIACTRANPEQDDEDLQCTRRPLKNDPNAALRGLYSDDDARLAKLCEQYLRNQGWWEMPPELHLSLLNALCYDITQGITLKADMSSKIQDTARIATDWSKELSHARKLRKDHGSAPELGRKRSGTAFSDDENDDFDDDDTMQDLKSSLQSREEEVEKQLEERAFRTECLGVDRYGRRYWWLRGTPGMILIETDSGEHDGVITKKENVDTLMKSLIRKSPREGNLLRRLRRFYRHITESLDPQSLQGLHLASIKRPIPKDGRQKQRDLETLKSNSTAQTLSDTKERLDQLLIDVQSSGIEIGTDLKGFRKDVRSLEKPTDVCKFLLKLESILCSCGEGLPPYASNEHMVVFLGEEQASKIPNVVPLRDNQVDQNNDGDNVNNNSVDIESRAMLQTNAAKPVGESNGIENSKDKDDDDDEEEEEEKDEITMLITANPLFKALRPFIKQPAPVSMEDDLDDSDVEHTYLREKRMRKPARLWRSGRERAVWIKNVLHAAEAPLGVAPALTAYITFVFSDRVVLLIERCLALEKEIARWEAEEAERRKAEQLMQIKKEEQELVLPKERPMMIRTGKAKTDGGVKVVLKLISREPFPQGRNATTAMDIMAPEEDVAKCRWGYQCSVCLLAGDLICCEHEDGCAVSVHPDCTGQPFPVGKWICTNHDESNLKTRVRKRAEQNKLAGDGNTAAKSLAEPDPLAELRDMSLSPPKRRNSDDDSTSISSSSSSDDDSDYEASVRPKKKKKKH